MDIERYQSEQGDVVAYRTFLEPVREFDGFSFDSWVAVRATHPVNYLAERRPYACSVELSLADCQRVVNLELGFANREELSTRFQKLARLEAALALARQVMETAARKLTDEEKT